MEEVQDTMVTKDELDQEGGEAINASASIAASEDKESPIEATNALSDTTSVTIPSFAKMRYAFDSEPESSSFGPYATYYIDFTVESQRVSIWHPRNDHSRDTCTVYYFIEFLGTEHHRNELGNHYATLFIGSALHED
ncbi:unnamed protein product [Taenia asiatica]|uniref:Uncharacterized protein n=1 Tax=Taenia asiatica TaxID=60517 RepID=A0A3P6Q683_TAEAS|nr:unnamed protein product [Taenia asiatica]